MESTSSSQKVQIAAEQEQEQQQQQKAYQAKIDAMQKYVPFLADLIKKLQQNSDENSAKIIQMQLLQNVLVNTEKSVSIDELNKVDEALEGIYKVYENKQQDDVDAVKNTEEAKIAADKHEPAENSEVTETANKASKETNNSESQDESPKDSEAKSSASKKQNNSSEETTDDVETKKEKENIVAEQQHTSNTKVQQESCASNGTKPQSKANGDTQIEKHKNAQVLETKQNDNGIKEKQQSNAVKGQDNLDEIDDDLKKDARKEKQAELKTQTDEEITITAKNNAEKGTETSCDDQLNGEFAKEKSLAAAEAEKMVETQEDVAEMEQEDSSEEDDEIEENVELIKFPEEQDADEMILPDSADEAEANYENTDTENEQEEDADSDYSDKVQSEKVEDELDKDDDDEQDKETETDDENTCDEEQHQNAEETEMVELETATNLNEETAESLSDEEDDELVSLHAAATTNTSQDDAIENVDSNKNSSYDPLNCENAVAKTNDDNGSKTTATKTTTTSNEEEEDDDVQVIETKADSPICIDSDDDDEDNLLVPITQPTTLPKRVGRPPAVREQTQMRVCARKSTAKPTKATATVPIITSKPPALVPIIRTKPAPTVPIIRSKPITLDYLKNANTRLHRKPAVDTIELLDSSDDDDNVAKTRAAEKTQCTTTTTTKRRQLLTKNNTSFKEYNKIMEKYSGNYENTTRTLTIPVSSSSLAAAAAAKRTPKEQPVYIATPQSNFLNAINLKPTKPLLNPPAFSARLSNKYVIIPNAFYGNPPTMRTAVTATTTKDKTATAATAAAAATIAAPPSGSKDNEDDCDNVERSHRRWIENFITQFANPKQIASFSCFILLQRVLRYKLFARIKEKRTHLNTLAHAATQEVDMQLMIDLRNAFFTRNKHLSELGKRLCELAFSHMIGKAVTLTTDSRNGRVTSRTRTIEEISLEKQINSTNKGKDSNDTLSPNQSSTTSTTTTGRKRPRDDGEYIPNKLVVSQKDKDATDERKRTLRTKRTRRFDNNFSYNEDQNDFEDDDEDDSYEAVQRRIASKRLEAKQQREKQVKSFENAFIEMFARNHKTKAATNGAAGVSRRTYSRNGSITNEEEITPDVGLNDDEPVEHRIYKVIPTKLKAAPAAKSYSKRRNDEAEPEVITCDIDSDTDEADEDLLVIGNVESADDDDDIIPLNSYPITDTRPEDAPKNTNQELHSLCKELEWCIICNRRIPRIVHHYVNVHRGCEVYISRLSPNQSQQISFTKKIEAVVSVYKNGQMQYEAECVFCAKRSRFMLPYWYQHLSMHTGEYAYRCNGCGVRKPTRSLLMAHINQPCPRGGKKAIQDFTYDSKLPEISASICTLCNYVQLHRDNVIQHLRTQHNIKRGLHTRIRTIPLLKPPSSSSSTSGTRNRDKTGSCTGKSRTTIRDNSSGAVYEIAEINDDYDDDMATLANSHNWTTSNNSSTFDYNNTGTIQPDNLDFGGTWDDGDPGDDLSFMICGMLDVEMNPK